MRDIQERERGVNTGQEENCKTTYVKKNTRGTPTPIRSLDSGVPAVLTLRPTKIDGPPLPTLKRRRHNLEIWLKIHLFRGVNSLTSIIFAFLLHKEKCE